MSIALSDCIDLLELPSRQSVECSRWITGFGRASVRLRSMGLFLDSGVSGAVEPRSWVYKVAGYAEC